VPTKCNVAELQLPVNVWKHACCEQKGVASTLPATSLVLAHCTRISPGNRLSSVLQVPWEPLLTREELLRGLSYYGTGARLQAVAAKLLAGQPIKVGRSSSLSSLAAGVQPMTESARFEHWWSFAP
jgi:hypothetical protein